MPDNIFLDTSSGSSNTHFSTPARVGSIPCEFFTGAITMVALSPIRGFFLSGLIQHETASEREFNEQKRLFEQIPPLLLEPYRGLFVISHNGQILDADTDLDALTNRFFVEHGDVPIYLKKIGGQLREVIDTHF